MAIKDKSEMSREITIDLTGPEGNAFVLLGYAKRYAKQLELDGNDIIKDMTSGDYEHLVDVFDSYFGNFVTLFR